VNPACASGCKKDSTHEARFVGAMRKEIVINSSPHEIRIAILEEGDLVELLLQSYAFTSIFDFARICIKELSVP